MSTPNLPDQEKLKLQLSRLEQSLTSLHNLISKKDDPILNAAKERFIQICIEEVINIANNIIISKGMRCAETYREIFIVLEENQIINSSLGKELQKFASFRNRLVHLYWNISPKEFNEQLKKINQLQEFARVITKKYVH